ncbi:MAG: hypothetical protein ACPG5B_03695 [Chitinophagales bacterium]
MKKNICLFLFCLLSLLDLQAERLLIQMDKGQKNHLKAYGIAYRALSQGVIVDWLLNYRGGCFAMEYSGGMEALCKARGVSFLVETESRYQEILEQIANPEANMAVVPLENAPKIAVYSPKNKPHHPSLPWDDAVTLVLNYAKIPYTVVYDEEVLGGRLANYDWLHLHHEDFTGQYGRFYRNYNQVAWYREQVTYEEKKAKTLGFEKVSQMKLAVAKKIKKYIIEGGFMFAMCSATDTYDIALSAEGTDICASMFDGDRMADKAQQKLRYDKCFAFHHFHLVENPLQYEFSDIDSTTEHERTLDEDKDYFKLFEFAAKWDPIPTMLTQSHTPFVKGFMGQTTAFKKKFIKKDVLILADTKAVDEARYLHNEYGKGFWTYYGGHDPEDYKHLVGEAPTDLSNYPNSAGYRLILNNILFPAAKYSEQGW